MSFYRQDDCENWKWSKVSKSSPSNPVKETDTLGGVYTLDKNPREGTNFSDYLKEQLKDPEFKKEWDKLCNEDMQKGCGMSNDLISREALKEVINDLFRTGEYDCNSVLKAIDNAPTVDVIANIIEVRPQGEWIDHTATQNLLWGHWECPFCHKRSNRGASYCQYCGARLENNEE